MSRPEGSKPPDLFYDETEARKYDSSSRMINIQREISNRAIEMLGLPTDRPSYILDVGCGSGLSGLALEEAGHYWVGCDISASMLDVANQRENEKGDLMKHDMGQGLPFRPGTFDGVISISALQWLCYSDSNDQNPIHRCVITVLPFHRITYRHLGSFVQIKQVFLIAVHGTQEGCSCSTAVLSGNLGTGGGHCPSCLQGIAASTLFIMRAACDDTLTDVAVIYTSCLRLDPY